jgi:hypothetical protein
MDMGSTCGSEATPRLDEIYQATLDAKDAELTASKHKIIELESKLAQQQQSIAKASSTPAASSRSTTTSAASAAAAERPVFFLNVIVLNKDEVVASKVGEKMGFGFAGRAATKLAQRVVKDERVCKEVATGLIVKLPKVLSDLGIDLELTQRYLSGPLIVFQCEIREVDGLALVTKAKGAEAARHFQSMTAAFEHFGIEAGLQQVRHALFVKSREALMEKLAVLLPERLLDAAGVQTDVVCKSEAAEAEWFFTFVEILKLGAKGTAAVPLS